MSEPVDNQTPAPFDEASTGDAKNKKSKSSGKLQREAEKYKEKLEKRGVIYMSRVPPFMKPNKARSVFEQYGEVTRLYLAEEDATRRQKRKEHGGNGSKQFSEGWIEFADKKVARAVADSLNNKCIGGKKGNFYHDDIWNLKYLKGFKWDLLTEKFAYEKRVKEQKLKVAMDQARRTNEDISQLIEQTKVRKHVEQRHKNKRSVDETNSASAAATEADERFSKRVKQAQPLAKNYGETKEAKVGSALISSIFAKKK